MAMVTEESVEVGPPLTFAVEGDPTMGGFLVDVANRYGDRTALVADAGRFTYTDLLDRATAVARGLLASGVTAGTPVGVLMPNGVDWIAATYGAALIGAVPVMLNVFSSVPEQEVALTMTEASVLLVTAETGGRPLLDGLVAANPKLAGGDTDGGRDDALPHLRQIVVWGRDSGGGMIRTADDLLAAGASVAVDEVERSRGTVKVEDDALVMFTSGTSGTPKAVVHGHFSPRLQPTVWARIQGMRPDERVFSTYPFCWSSGFARSLAATLYVGGCMITVEHFEPGAALKLMAQERVTLAILPGQGHLDLRLVEHPDFASTDLSSLDRPSNPILARALNRGDGWRGAGYGLTETFTLCTATPAADHQTAPAGNSGRALPGWTVKVVDPDTGKLVKRGEIGQIKVKGPSLMKRYHGREPGAGFDDEGFLVTPDLGSLDDEGYLYFASRIDDIVRSAGVNVSTSEIERELTAMDGVRLSVALGLPHPTLGQALVVCVVRDDPKLEAADVVSWLRPRVASYKLPRAVLFIEESDLRFTISQKVQLAELRQLAAARVAQLGLW